MSNVQKVWRRNMTKEKGYDIGGVGRWQRKEVKRKWWVQIVTRCLIASVPAFSAPLSWLGVSSIVALSPRLGVPSIVVAPPLHAISYGKSFSSSSPDRMLCSPIWSAQTASSCLCDLTSRAMYYLHVEHVVQSNTYQDYKSYSAFEWNVPFDRQNNHLDLSFWWYIMPLQTCSKKLMATVRFPWIHDYYHSHWYNRRMLWATPSE